MRVTDGEERNAHGAQLCQKVVGNRFAAHFHHRTPQTSRCRAMAPTSSDYLAVLKASFDYDPQSEDEIAIKEDQLLLLIQKVDDE